MDATHVLDILEKRSIERDGLIPILEDIQARFSYLPEASLRVVAEKTGSSLVDVYAVATFYRAFTLEPRGKHLVSVCLGTACHVRGAPKVAEEFSARLKVEPGQTTEDKEFTLETVNCLGACAIGPIVVVDGRYHSNVKQTDVSEIARRTHAGNDAARPGKDESRFPVELSCARCNHSLLDASHPIDGFPSIRVTTSCGRKHGSLRLSSLYGSYAVESDYEIPVDSIVDFFCPHCHGELRSATQCTSCNAPMVPMIAVGGGMVQICSRRGCREHRLDVTGVSS